MPANSYPASTSVAIRGLCRRSLLAMVVATGTLGRLAHADTTPANPTATVRQFNEALLVAMKTGQQTDFGRRFQALAPAVDQAFDLRTVLADSVGFGWANLSPDQQNRLLEAFRRYTVASYLANFDNFAGQTFTVSSETRGLGAGRVIVQSQVVPVRGDPVEMDSVPGTK
jgi:phospholipid transport system substrate-binding protein